MPYLLDRDGGEFAVNTSTSSLQEAPRIVALSGGGFVILWQDFSGTGGDSDRAVRAQLFGADGAPVGGEFLVNTTTDGPQFLADAIPTENGGFLVTWTDQFTGDAFAQFFDAAGAKIGSEFRITAVAAGIESSPGATILDNGNYLFTWSKDGAVQTRLFDAAGQPLGGDVSIAPGGGAAALGLESGRYVLAWGSTNSMRVQLFEANGTAIGESRQINLMSDSAQGPALLTTLSNGGFALVWRYLRGGDSEIKIQTFDAQGQPTSEVVSVNSLRDGQQTQPDLTPLPDGGFLVSWTDSSQRWGDTSSTGIVAQAFNADGSRSGTNFGVNAVTADVQNSPTVAALADGRVVIAWTGNDGSFSGIRAQIFEPSGGPDDISLSVTSVSETAVENLEVATIGSTGSLNGEGTSTYTYLSDSAGGAFRVEGNRLVMADNGRLDFELSPTVSVTLRVTDETGASHEETIVLDVTDVAQERRYSAGTVGDVSLSFAPDVAALPGGGFVVAGSTTDPWGPGGAVGLQLFDAAGVALGPVFIANTTADNAQGSPSVATLGGGGFVVVWTDTSTVAPDTSGASVRGQRFDTSGNRVGTEFLINVATNGDQSDGEVTALAGGGFVVTWQDTSQTGGDPFSWSIKARIYDAAGVAVGGEFLVNTSVTGLQSQPGITALSSGGFVIVWNDAGDGDAIKAQIFNIQGAKVGGELVVESDFESQFLNDVVGLAGGGFVTIFQKRETQGGPTELAGQLIDAAGVEVGPRFAINTVTEGTQVSASAQALASGGFVVTWFSTDALGIDRQIKAQLFDAAGVRQGDEFRLSDIGGDSSNGFPVVTELSDGRLLFAWEGFPDDDFRILTPVQPVNAIADSGTTFEDRSLIGNVLSNDLHDAGAILRVASVNGQAANVGQAIILASGARLTLNADGSYVYNPNGAFDALLNGQSAADSFSYGLTNGTSATVNITINGVEPISGDAGNNVLNGTIGNDSFRAEQGGDDSVFGLQGNDGFYFGGALTLADSVDGGPGTDTLAIQGQYASLVLAGVSNVEVLLVLPGDDTRFGYLSGLPTSYAITGLNANIAAGATLTVQATTLRANENLLYDGSNEIDGNFRFFLGRGTDSLIGGAGNDGFFFGAEGNLTGADRINGGAGTDSIALRGNYVGATAVVFQNGSFANIEVVTLLSGHTNEFGGFIDTNGFDYDLTLADGTLAAGARLDVIAGNLRANESARVDARAELDGSVRIIAGAGDDILFGSAGADVLAGGLGADALDGSGGNDLYIYRSAGESLAASRDTVAFAGGDRIDLSLIDADAGTAANDAFTFIGSGAFSNVAGQLRIAQIGAQWIVEGDVNGDGAADLVIAVDTVAALTAADFIL